jgi:23S rRNA pseudouridine1911/1915/1917 synthase
MKSFDSAEILFCDNHLLVAAKPSNMLTQPDHSDAMSLEAWAKEWVKKEFQKKGAVFLHCIYRLDRPVSGLVLFARTSKALSRLNEQMRNLEIQKIYVAEVEGILPKGEAERLDHYLIHGDHRAIIAKEGTPGAKHARLQFEVIHSKAQTSYVRIELETGRYHQIRAQFSATGHPIVGDRLYGSKTGDSKEIRLHCFEISFQHPVTKEQLSFTTPAPFD